MHVAENDVSGGDLLFSYAPTNGFYNTGTYAFDAHAGVITRTSPTQINSLFVSGGTFLTDQNSGITLVSNLNGTEPFEATYKGTTVAVSGRIISKVTL